MSIIDKDEVKAWAKIRDRAVAASDGRQTFEKAYSVAKGSSDGGGSGSGSAPRPRISPYPEVPTGLKTQKQLKPFMPPGHTVWTGFSRGSWWCHPKPHPRKEFPWGTGGNAASMAMLAHCWRIWLVKEGRPFSECPVPNLVL